MLSPQEQYQLEVEADASAAAARLEELRQAALAGDITLPRAQRYMAHAYTEVRKSLSEVYASKSRGVGGKVRGWIKALPIELVAALSIRVVMQLCSTGTSRGKPVTLQHLAGSVGRAIELELRIQEAEAVNPLYMQRVEQRIEDARTTSTSHIRAVYSTAYKSVLKDAADTGLSETELMQLGKFGVNACLEAGIIEQQRTWGSGGKLVYYDLAEEVVDYLRGYGAKDVQNIVDVGSRAMLCPPEPWSTLTDGGYMSPRRKLNMPLMPLKHIRASERPRLREEFTAERMPLVFECANYLQSIAMSVHTPTLRAIRVLWEQGGGVMGVPSKTQPARPPCPFPKEWDKHTATEHEVEVFQRWKRDAVKAYDSIRTWRGKMRELGGFIKHVSQYPDGTPLWFPVFMDTRSRWYYRGSPNPQGSDMAKAALHFAEKRPLGKRGLFWLKVAVANCYGFDKARFADRAAWTDENWSTIEAALDAPWDRPEVFGADSPWCMYSAAWELREALRSGSPSTYQTGIVVHMDATCSGIQHFSAMLRDPVGGRYVNLYDESFVGPKNDLYGEVGSTALKSIRHDLDSEDDELRGMAEFWVEHGIPRSLAKKPVMTYVYGATVRGTAQFILNELEESGTRIPEHLSKYGTCMYLGKRLFRAIGRTVPAAEYGMHWLRKVARDAPKGKRMQWRTPTGFLVQHDYQAYEELRVKIRSCGVQTMLIHQPIDGVRPLQMQNAIAPNFVHALDASHLTLTALSMKQKGLSMVGIHDSFGTHPDSVDDLHSSVREEFVRLYESRHILSDFLWDVGVEGEAPLVGNLDLKRVLNSEFFFC